jgi:hypothetical protein
MKKKPPLLPTIIICRFERRCGTFRGKGGKNLMSLTTLISLLEKIKKIKHNFKKN